MNHADDKSVDDDDASVVDDDDGGDGMVFSRAADAV